MSERVFYSRVFHSEGLALRVSEESVDQIISSVFSFLEERGFLYPGGCVEVAFVTDEEIREVNLECRSKDYVTDVISFSYMDGGDVVSGVLGELIISLDKAESQASSFGNDFPSEVIRLLVHGLLHICGFEHEDVPIATRREMELLEDELCLELNNLTEKVVSQGRT